MNWFTKNKNGIIRTSFLLPILLVVIISISHVVNWYEIGNPVNWAIYLSVAIEIFALTSVSAATININKTTIWFLFALVTIIQLIGNVFFSYNHIDSSSEIFVSWVELIGPFFEDWDILSHKRFLALVQGGTLPIMSLTALHFYLKFNENLDLKEVQNKSEEEETTRTIDNDPTPMIDIDSSSTGNLTPNNDDLTLTEDDVINEDKEVVKKKIFETPEEVGINSGILEPIVEELVITEETPINDKDVPIIDDNRDKDIIPDKVNSLKEELKREDIKEVKLRENKSNITRIGSNKFHDGNNTNKIVFDNGKKRRNR